MTAAILLTITVIFWGMTFVATKICLGYLAPIEVMGLRLFVGLPVMFIIILARGLKFDFKGHRTGLALGAIILTAHFLIQIIGIKYTSATNTGWLIAAIPLITAVLAFLILKERIGRNVIAGIIIATAGILLLISKGRLFDFGWLSSIGDWLVLGSAHTWALYTIATRDLSRACNPLTVTFTMLLAPALVALVVMLPTSQWSAFLNLPAIAVPYLHESFGMYTAIGGFLVLLGVGLAQRKVGLKPL